MATNQVIATFPGVKSVRSCTFTWTRGTAPATGTLECFPQFDPVSQVGDLTLRAGNEFITISDCRIGRSSMVISDQGPVLSLQIIDYRWRWEFGEINGEYNIPDRKGLPVHETAKDAYELMNRCLIAMGVPEGKYDTSAVPPGINPHVNWVGANPAKALSSLCDLLGFIVCPKFDGRVVIEKLGEGDDLPDGGEINVGPVVDPPERPDSIQVLAAPTRFQMLLRLEPVAQDVDGKWKPINDLTFIPSWNPPSTQYFNGLKWIGAAPENLIPGSRYDRDVDLKYRLAKRVHRCYRIKVEATGEEYKVELPTRGMGEAFGESVRVADINEILPISGDLVETFNYLNWDRKRKARIYGEFFVGNTGPGLNSNQKFVEVSHGIYTVQPITFSAIPGGGGVEGAPICFQYQQQLAAFPGEPSNFSIHEDLGIVEFPDSVTRLKTFHNPQTGADEEFLVAADLWLMCSFNWRNWQPSRPDNFRTDLYAYRRYRYTYNFPGQKFGTGPEIVLKEAELQAQVYASYEGYQSGAAPGVPPGSKTPTWHYLRPISELDDAAKHYAEGAAQKYKTVEAIDKTYVGLKKFDLDGAIAQITWEVGPNGATTRAGRNTEPHPYVRPYRYTRFIEQVSTLTKDFRALPPDPSRPFIPVM